MGSIACFAQPFGGLAVSNKGSIFQIGILAEAIELTAAYKVPFSRADIPRILSLSVGKQVLISRKEANNYSVTASIGVTKYMITDFTKYDESGDEGGGVVLNVTDTVPV